MQPLACESRFESPKRGTVTTSRPSPLLWILVDRTSVEMFVGDGRVVHSHRVSPLDGDDGIRLYAHEGAATFRDLTVREISI